MRFLAFGGLLLSLLLGICLLVFVKTDPVVVLGVACQRILALDLPSRVMGTLQQMSLPMELLVLGASTLGIVALVRGRDILRFCTSLLAFTGLLWGLTEVLMHFARVDLRDYLGGSWWLLFFVLPGLLALLDSPQSSASTPRAASADAEDGDRAPSRIDAIADVIGVVLWPLYPLYMLWDRLYVDMLEPAAMVTMVILVPILASAGVVWIVGSLIRRWV